MAFRLRLVSPTLRCVESGFFGFVFVFALPRLLIPGLIVFFPSFSAHKGQAAKRPVRAHGAHAPQPTARCAFCALSRARAVAYQGFEGEDAAAGGVLDGGVVGDRDFASQWGV